MKHLTLCLLLLAACSKSSANATKNKEDVVVAPVDVTPCEEACTKYAVCFERMNAGETFHSGGGCVERCEERPAPDRATWTKYVDGAECATLFPPDEEVEAEDDDEAGMAPGNNNPVELPAAKLGCFGWSTHHSAAACIVGSDGTDGTDLKLAFIGGGDFAPMSLEDKTAANSKLLDEGFNPINTPPIALVNRKPKNLGDATLRFTQIETDAGGNNVAPTNSYQLIAVMGGKNTQLFKGEGEGLSAKVTARAVTNAHILVEIALHTGREGESTDTLEVVVFDTQTGKVTRSKSL
jgi:hypothetical protein